MISTAILLALLVTLFLTVIRSPYPVETELVEYVSNSNAVYSGYHAHNDKTFHTLGYHWIFVEEKTAGADCFCARSSSNGVTWSDRTFLSGFLQFSVAKTNGTHAFALSGYTSGIDVRFRLVTLNSDGTVYVGAARSVNPNSGWYTDVAIDSYGYPWALYANGTLVTDLNICVERAVDKNGSDWSGQETMLCGTNVGYAYLNLHALPNGEMYAIMIPNDSNFYGQLYNGTSWEANQTIVVDDGSGLAGGGNPYWQSEVDVNSNIWLMWANATNSPREIWFTMRDYSTGTWSTPEILYTLVLGGLGEPEITALNDGSIQVSWLEAPAGSVNVFAAIYENGVLETPVILATSPQSIRGRTYHAYPREGENGEIGHFFTSTPTPYDYYFFSQAPYVPQSPANVWITGVAAPYVYAAITVSSMAAIVGVGLVFIVIIKSPEEFDALALIGMILTTVGIVIVLFISLAIMSGFLSL